MNPKQFTGHTPGTWLARTGSVIAGSKVLACVHNHYHQGMTEAEAEANARLMAAAPDLLAENQRLREALERYADPMNWGYYDESGCAKGAGRYDDACFVGPLIAREALKEEV
jgi:hypothetical protein